jgi:hypothetical protein
MIEDSIALWYTPSMKIRDIAERLQLDVIESPREKPKRTRSGGELQFVQKELGDWGYELSHKKIQTLATNSTSY